MSFTKTAVLGAALTICGTATAQTTTLTTAGKSDYVITLASDAIPAEVTAARQLQSELKQISGATLAIKRETEVRDDSQQILIGSGPRVKALTPDINWSSLGHDGIVIRTSGSKLILAGGRPRGTLYAVFQFLEETVGVRWWTPEASFYPKKPTLEIPAQNTVYTPPFNYRVYFTSKSSGMEDVSFTTKMKQNGHHNKQDASWGGHYKILGLCHTFFQLLPPEKYFKDHPEWYTDRNGKLLTKDSPMPPKEHGWQICASNDEARQELTKEALKWVRKNPEAGIISISQNDGDAHCLCPRCKALEDAEGTPQAPLLRLVNLVAEDIEKEFPDFQVQALAYSYSLNPPKTIRPRKNVQVCVCTNHQKDVDLWKPLTDNIYVWNYMVNFGNGLTPFPNFRGQDKRLRLLASSNVKNVFALGNYYTESIGDFTPLRFWLQGHLLWDPKLDQKPLIAEFLKGYYHEAAPFLGEYIDLIEDSFEQSGIPLRGEHYDFNFLTLDTMNRATELFDQAEAAVKDDKTVLDRVRRERLSLDDAWILRYQALRSTASYTNKPFKGPEDIAAFTKTFIATAKSFGMVNIREYRTFDDYAKEISAKSATSPLPPALAAQVPPKTELRNVIDVYPASFYLYPIGNHSSLVDDPQAAAGQAARLNGNTGQWAVQFRFRDIDPNFLSTDKWRCYVSYRTQPNEPIAPGANAVTIGILQEKKGGLIQGTETMAATADGKYHLMEIGTTALAPNCTLWIGPPNNPKLDALFIDRMIFIRQTPAN